MCFGGGGGDGRQEYSWNPTMAAYWQGTEENPGGYLGVANSEFWKNYGQGYQQYGGERVAGLDPYQDKALSGINDMASRPEAMPDVWAGRQQNADTAQGKFLNQNAFAQQQNLYGGMESPYFQKMVQSGLGDMADAYQRGTASQTNALMNMSGVLGGGDHMKAVSNNQAAFAKQAGDFTNQMYNQQYDRSGQMDESRLQRGMNAWENERGRMLQGAQQGMGGQALSSDLYNQLMNAGGMRRGVQQQRNDVGWQNFQDQQNYGRNQLDWMGNFLSRAQGGIGGQVNMYGGGGGSNAAGALGTALMGYGMFRG